MSRWRRLLKCLLGLGFLVALGGVVFHFVRHKPRCVITGPLGIQHLSLDGSRLVTIHQPSRLDFNSRRGPVQVWDIRRGELLREGLVDTNIWIVAVSPDGGHVAVLPRDDTLRLFGCDSGEEHCIRIAEPLIGDMSFSPTGRWLCLDRGLFVDVAHRQVIPTPKGSFLCFNSEDHGVFVERESPPAVSVVDLRTGETVANAVLGSSFPPLVSHDGSVLVAWRGEGKPLPDRLRTEENHGLEIWDLTNLKQRSHWMVPESFVHPSSQAVFSSDNRILAYWDADASAVHIRFFDTSQGRPLGSTKIAAKNAEIQLRAVPPSGAVWTCVYEEGEQAHLVLMEAATGRVIDKRQQDAFFTRVANDTVLWHDPGEDSPCLQLLDARTGFCRAKTRIGRCGMVEHVSPDGRHIVATVINDGLRDREAFFWEELLNERWPELFRRHLDTVFVIEAATGRERFSTPAYPMWDKRLADDGGTFVSVDWSSDSNDVAIGVWDVEPTRAWLWTIGVPTALAAAWALLARFRRIRPINQPTTGQIENLPHAFS